VIKDNEFRTLGQGIFRSGLADSRIENNRTTKNYGSGCVPAVYAVDLRNAKQVNVLGNKTESKEGELLADAGSAAVTQLPAG